MKYLSIYVALISINLILTSSCNNAKTNDLLIKQQFKIDSLTELANNLSMQNNEANLKIDSLEKVNHKNKIKNDATASNKQTGSENDAIAAIIYQLEMYHPDVKYTNIRAVKKTDGTIDVIVDIPDVFNSHKYYNVSTFSNGTYRINDEWGIVF